MAAVEPHTEPAPALPPEPAPELPPEPAPPVPAQPEDDAGAAEAQPPDAEPPPLPPGEDDPPGSEQPAEGGSSNEMADMSPEEQDRLLKEFFQEVREVDRDNEVNRILGAFKLNPMEQLGLRFDASLDDIKRQYRKTSLLVHPDKCKHPRAQDAFEVLGHAHKQLQDKGKLKELIYVLDLAREEVRKERKKVTKKDAALRLATTLHKDGRAGVEADYEQTEEYHKAWVTKSRDVIARAEWRRRKLNKRLAEEQLRIEDDEADTRKRLKETREDHKKWEETRENRVGTWRDFVGKKGKPKKAGEKMVAGSGIKPPKLVEEDQERTYIPRPVGEQHRPPPPKPAQRRQP